MVDKVLVLVWHIHPNVGSDQKVQTNRYYRSTAPIGLIKIDAANSLKIDPANYKLILFSTADAFDMAECDGIVGDYAKILGNEKVATFMFKSLKQIEDENKAKADAEEKEQQANIDRIYELFRPHFERKK